MARAFNDAATQYLQRDGTVPIAAAPLTMSAWFNSDDATINQCVLAVLDKDLNANHFSLQAFGGVAGDPCGFEANDGATSGAITTTGFSANTWHHLLGVENATNDRFCLLDGGGKGTSIVNRVPAGLDRTTIGYLNRLNPLQIFSGAIAEAAIWDVALSEPEGALLAKGFSPLFVQPQNLVAYWPLIRDDDNDWVGGFDLTAFNAPTVATHPPLIVHPVVQTAPDFIAERIVPTTVYGLGIVNNIILLSPIYGLGAVFPLAVKQIVTFRDQRPSLAIPGLAEYKVRIKNQDGEPVAEFDTWLSLFFTHKVNNRGSCRFEINGEDSRIQYLTPDSDNLDNQIEVWRRNPIVGLDWYVEWEGFLRTNNDLYEQNDNNKFVAHNFSYLDLARRAEIKWAATTPQADKSGVGETVIKQYVSENIGVAALLASGREADNVMPGLSIQADLGAGATWDGAMADKNLLDTLQKIALATGVDFDIIGTGAALFQFVTYDGQRADRTKTNADGNAPVIFSLGFGNMIVPVLSRSRSTEITAAYALGKGVNGARQTELTESLARLDSPWNRIEKTVSASNTAGDALGSVNDEALEKNAEQIKFNFQVLQTVSAYYGLHYWWGDRVTAQYKTSEFDKKITEAQITVSENAKGEQISLTFADN
jgi:hypothetical protein